MSACAQRRPWCLSSACLDYLLSAGAEFWSAFFFASTLAIPIVFYATHYVPEVGSLVLALGGVLLAVVGVAAAVILQARAESDSYLAW